MSNIAHHYIPITDIYFHEKREVNLKPGESIVHISNPKIIGIHVFNWSPNSWITIQTTAGQTIKFPPTSLVEGAVYYMNFSKLIEAGPSPEETQVMAIAGI
jgi:hypothetical protein